MYSALISHSSMVAERPLFKRIGLSILPSSFKSSKFCIFLAPTWIISTFSNISMWDALIISVTIGSPVSFLAIFKRSRPSAFKPWKAYGEVLGLNAPPLKNVAPDAFTLFAISTIWVSLSTEHGPAIMCRLPPPIVISSLILIFVSSGWNFLLAFLYGSWTLLTFSTMSWASM